MISYDLFAQIFGTPTLPALVSHFFSLHQELFLGGLRWWACCLASKTTPMRRSRWRLTPRSWKTTDHVLLAFMYCFIDVMSCYVI